MSYLVNTCDCSGEVFFHACQSTTCGFDLSGNLLEGSKWDAPGNVAINQKRIWNQVRAPSSVYTMNLGALTVNGNNNNQPTIATNYVNWNQMSDRVNPHTMQFQNHPSRGNSTKRTLTSIKPGACTPGGTGVDIKHGSYARYLARKKAGNIRTQSDYSAASTPKYGNKTKKYGMIANSENCPCTLGGVTDLASIINNLKSYFESSPQYEDYTLCLAGDKETIGGDLGHDLSVGFIHLYAGETDYDSINYVSIKNMINTVNVACSDVDGFDNFGLFLGIHTLALVPKAEEPALHLLNYGKTYWHDLRVYGNTFIIETDIVFESGTTTEYTSGMYQVTYSSTNYITFSASGTYFHKELSQMTGTSGTASYPLYYIKTGATSTGVLLVLSNTTYTCPSPPCGDEEGAWNFNSLDYWYPNTTVPSAFGIDVSSNAPYTTCTTTCNIPYGALWTSGLDYTNNTYTIDQTTPSIAVEQFDGLHPTINAGDAAGTLGVVEWLGAMS